MALRVYINNFLGMLGIKIVRTETLEHLLASARQLQEAETQRAAQEIDDNVVLQTIAIERYIANPPQTPGQFFPMEKVLLVNAEEVARALSLAVMYINTSDVKGDVIEFGTMSGFSAKIVANAMMYDLQRQPSYPFRRLRLFDSFVGLPEIVAEPDTKSPHVVSGAWSAGGCKVLSAAGLREVVTKIIPDERVEIVEGWFSDTVAKLPDDTRLAMIHFDGDLYQSMIDALTPCFAKGFISRGAVLCFDDWNCNQADPAFGERKAWAELAEQFAIQYTFYGCYGETGAKLLIHSYNGMRDGQA